MMVVNNINREAGIANRGKVVDDTTRDVINGGKDGRVGVVDTSHR